MANSFGWVATNVAVKNMLLHRREDLCQGVTEPLGFLQKAPPSDQVQVQHATHSSPVFQHQTVQMQALLDTLEKEFGVAVLTHATVRTMKP